MSANTGPQSDTCASVGHAACHHLTPKTQKLKLSSSWKMTLKPCLTDNTLINLGLLNGTAASGLPIQLETPGNARTGDVHC